jgi:nucleotide-binding universal stress UspA family protein
MKGPGAMVQFHNVLCAIDFSEISARALTHAAALARWYEAHLEVLHVVPALADDANPPARFGPDDGAWPSRERLLVAIERAMEAADATTPDSRPLVEEGRADEIIACRARALPADLVVMGTHGRSGFNRALLGSVTEKVLRQVSCPVLTVPPAAPTRAGGPVRFKNILCAVDYSPSASKALQYALDLARQAGGAVTVLHALEYTDADDLLDPSKFDPCREEIAESRRRRQAVLDRARTQLHAQLALEPTTWCDIQEVVAVDRAYKAILGLAADADTDLIVMGAQGAGGLELLLYGSNTQHVLRAATCPVLTVRA